MSDQPYCVVAEDQATLYRTADGQFQIIRDGRLSSILSGWSYVLVTPVVLNIFRQVGIAVEDRPALVSDRTTGLSNARYREIRIDAEITPETVNDTGPDVHLWRHANRDVFVSADLRRRLADACPDLSFSKGFSRFVAQ